MLMNRPRNSTGNILLFAVCIIILVLLPLMMMLSNICLFFIDKARSQTAVEAAGLLAANDLSRLFIDDPNFGYVSLSNYPPIGKATCAQDGEPLPVVGINTLVGTIRQNTIVAHELVNPKIGALADRDRNNLDDTVKELNSALAKSLSGRDGAGYVDIHGKKVSPVKNVARFLSQSLPPGVRLESFTLTNGWLDGGGDSAVAVPEPRRLAYVQGNHVQAGNYRPFVDIPFANRSFTFAGVGPSSSMVDPAGFHPADGKHICSIVKIECNLVLDHIARPLSSIGLAQYSRLKCVACCQPYCLSEIGPKGVMTLRFTGGPGEGMKSWNDFLHTESFSESHVTAYDAVGGDYPLDSEAKMMQRSGEEDSETAAEFAAHLYYWLRTGHVSPRIDSIVEMVHQPFEAGANQIYAYEITPGGYISRRVLARDPFPIGVTADCQKQTVIDARTPSGLSPVIVFRNDVKFLGAARGGKHGGQPLAGTPLNWCELSEYGGDEHMAKSLGKGHLGTKLSMGDDLEVFRASNGENLALQPRKSFYSGGLAVDIEIGGTAQASPIMDIASMRRFTMYRRI